MTQKEILAHANALSDIIANSYMAWACTVLPDTTSKFDVLNIIALAMIVNQEALKSTLQTLETADAPK
jgi:hypothetical protein